MTIVISKLNKKSYNSPKFFQPIVLLNILEKLIEKVIGKQFQFCLISNDFIYPCQSESLKQRSMSDIDIALTYFIQSDWTRNNTMSTLAFDIVQFFPFLNHQLLLLILKKAGYYSKVIQFFSNYLVDRKTQYSWNNSTRGLISPQKCLLYRSCVLPIALYSF